jgi:riboflavin synthase
MFTGIIEARGVVESIQRLELNQATVVRLVVATDLDVETLPIGGSIAVDGVCLTVVERAVGRFGADLGPETLALTTLGSLDPGSRVHLERPLKVGDPLGGHMVAGHVDITGTLVARRPVGASLELDIEAPAQVARFLAAKGSVAVDGVSLTVNTVEGNVFSVTLIPHTLEVTKLGDKRVGAAVNLEADMIVKHIDRLMAAQFGGERGSAGDALRRYGLVR